MSVVYSGWQGCVVGWKMVSTQDSGPLVSKPLTYFKEATGVICDSFPRLSFTFRPNHFFLMLAACKFVSKLSFYQFLFQHAN